MTSLEALQEWYLAQCNDDWEHAYGIDVGTLDNPGWSLTVELTDTNLEDKPYVPYSYGIGEHSEPSSHDWLSCKVEKGKFVCHGGPRKLEEMINVFLSWAKTNV